MSTENRFYTTKVFQEPTSRLTKILDEFEICFYFYKVTQIFHWIGGRREEAPGGEEILVAKRRYSVPGKDFELLSTRHQWTRILSSKLSEMGVPEIEHPNFIEKIFEWVELFLDPKRPIVAIVQDTTHRYLESESESESNNGIIVNRVMRESLETYMPKLIPTTKSSIQGLEKVRLDRLKEAIIRHSPSCVICMEGLDHRHFDTDTNAAAQNDDVNGQPTMITLLPCSHPFHGDCIVQWLEISHFCPVCRFPMPAVEEGEPSEPDPRIPS